jgi:hypothetical protein
MRQAANTLKNGKNILKTGKNEVFNNKQKQVPISRKRIELTKKTITTPKSQTSISLSGVAYPYLKSGTNIRNSTHLSKEPSLTRNVYNLTPKATLKTPNYRTKKVFIPDLKAQNALMR